MAQVTLLTFEDELDWSFISELSTCEFAHWLHQVAIQMMNPGDFLELGALSQR